MKHVNYAYVRKDSVMNVLYNVAVFLPFPAEMPESGSLQQIIDQIIALTGDAAGGTQAMIAAAVTLILGLVACFFGYKASRFFIALCGFILGCVLGSIAVTSFLHVGVPLSILITIAIGIVVACLSSFIYRLGIFVFSFVLAFSAGVSLIPLNGDLQFFVCLILGFVVASLAVKFIRPVIIFTSAAAGSFFAAGSAQVMASNLHLTLPSLLQSRFTLGLFLCLLGIAVQLLMTREKSS